MFRLENVNKIYRRRGSNVVALQATSLEICAGDYIAVVGPSGSGKTTLLSLLGGMLSPNAGRVWLGDTSLYEVSIAERTRLRREKIGFVFQTFNLVPYLTAVENVQVPLYLAGVPTGDQRARTVASLVRVGLGDRLDHKPHELSTGQQQRVALARTVVNDPPVILADEPTGNLDPDSCKRVLDFFDELQRENRTIIMVTHDPQAAERARRRISLCDGSVSTGTLRMTAKAA
jgi:putative ABC transport system ATP-binding protein